MNSFSIELVDNLSYKWMKTDKIYTRGFAFFNGKLYENEAFLGLFQGITTEADLLNIIENLDGFFNVIVINEARCYVFVDQIRSMPIILDKSDQECVVIRDDLGQLVHGLTISTEELSAFRHALFTQGNNTLFENVSQLGAGEYAVINEKTIEFHSYFSYKYNSVREKKIDVAVEQLNQEYIEVMERTKKVLNGRTVVIPLSGGHDSRLLLYYLYNAGYRDIVAYSYGLENNSESKISERVAEFFGIPYYFIPYKKRNMRKLFTQSFQPFSLFAFQGTSVPCLQEWYAVYYLKTNALIPDDAVFMPGYTGDFMAGAHLNKNWRQKSDLTRGELVEYVFERYYAEYDYRYPYAKEYIFECINKQLIPFNDKDNYTQDEANECAERFDYYNRQAKFIENALRVYDYFGYKWVTPYFYKTQFEIWSRVDNSIRYGRMCFFELEKKIYPKDLANIEFYVGTNLNGFIKRNIARIRLFTRGPRYLHFMYGYYNLGFIYVIDLLKKRIRNIDVYAKDELLRVIQQKQRVAL